jgi:hypothetical protein
MDSLKDFICYESMGLPRDISLEIMKIVKRHDATLLQRFPDGTRIHLDKLPDHIIKQISDYIKHKICPTNYTP